MTDVQYYFSPQSPWTYLGHRRFWDIARQHQARVELLPVDLGGKIFPVSGGQPLAQRAPQRQAYRRVELQRFADHLQVPLNLQPKFFPVAGDAAARLIIAVGLHDGVEAAMGLTDAVLRAVWLDEGDIADPATLATLLRERDLPAQRLDAAHAPAVQERYEANTQRAIDAGVFGAPSYVIDREIFWGQDRIDFVERRLAASGAAAK